MVAVFVPAGDRVFPGDPVLAAGSNPAEIQPLLQ